MADLARLMLPEEGTIAEGAGELYLRGTWSSVDAAGVTLGPGQRLSLGTWLNAAPAGWWAQILGPLSLRLTVQGRGACRVVRSAGGVAAPSAAVAVDGRATFALPCDGTVEWYWIEWDGGSTGGVLESAIWHTSDLPDAAAPVTVVVPTFRREADCLAQVRGLLAADAGTVGRVVVVDQGGTFRAHCDEVGWNLDDWSKGGEPRLLVVEQENWGGSGGYGRGMRESLAWPESPVLLLDDDARIEVETIRRMAVLSNHAMRPTLLGTALFSAEHPTKLQTLSEGVNRRIFQWGPNDGVEPGIDPTETDPSRWRFTGPQDHADYAGWWGAMLPAGAVAELGQPLPYFLKWDDAEYGLRALEAGYDARTVPTTAAWHPTWAAKGTIASWDSWPLHRNRFETARRYGAGRGVVLDSFVHQVKHVLSLQYETAALWNAAIEEFLAGPGWMEDEPGAVRQRAVGLLERCREEVVGAVQMGDEASVRRPDDVDGAGVEGDADVEIGDAVLVEAGSVGDPNPTVTPDAPESRPARPGAVPALAMRALLGVTGLVRRNQSETIVSVPSVGSHWTNTVGADIAVLTLADGSAGTVLVRNPRTARSLLARTARLHLRLATRWGR